ncbi:MAG: DNA translocase FtsK, partial [Defluviitaleaceae bacterium]|nr:DNA translocase FtsK [Defluviitaleaceae bacterium]
MKRERVSNQNTKQSKPTANKPKSLKTIKAELETEKKNTLMNETIPLAILALSIFILGSLFWPNSTGFIGRITSTFLNWAFGGSAFAFIFIVICVAVNHIIYNNVTIKIMAAILGIFSLTIAFISIFFRLGFIGGFLSLAFIAIFGYVGTFIVIISGIIGSAFFLASMLTGKSLLKTANSKIKESGGIGESIKKMLRIEMPLEYYEDDFEDSEEYEEEFERRPLPKALTLKLDDDDYEEDEETEYNIEDSEEDEEREEPYIKKLIRESLYFDTGGQNQKEVAKQLKPKQDKLLAPLHNYEPPKVEYNIPHAMIKISGPAKIETALEDDYNENIIEANTDYVYPTRELLKTAPLSETQINHEYIIENSRKLEETLRSFGVTATVKEVSQGPTVTRYELSPGSGVKVSKISNLADDLALNLAARGIRIEAPIPGKSVVGVEVPNESPSTVYFSELIESTIFKNFPSKLAFAIGKDIEGKVVVFDIAKMPHLLIAGATGSGKSVCINTLIVSLLYKSLPEEVKLIMIDPKVVELSVYDGIPHLLVPVVTDPKKAAGALNWAVREMLKRYEAFATTSVRDLEGYNRTLRAKGEKTLPQIVIIIDELSDLMMAAPNEVEDAICRLAQMARAAGIHLIIATQRPSVDVITGLIKANVPSRLAFSVSSGTDSRTILDSVGAEKLLGRGDMLFSPIGVRKPMRVQGAFIS